ncbi:hypothetical protein DB313_04675 (plasmid) [Borrelia turcica IST7]|uniref:Lipoprotein n=1 Tax=Borrelia turcica IST7 TaxID=1104446 RepID=A0A386PMJ7_9SPIR|nr:hypothetical protein [Borrelia turcica]AYE36796.1 hypothetical protein DB313_04675 [Borrelia turcica IST7]
MRNELKKFLILIMISMFFIGCNQGNNDIKMKSKGGAVSSGRQKHSQKGDNSGDDDSGSDEMSSLGGGVDGSMLSDEPGRVKRETFNSDQFERLIKEDLTELNDKTYQYLSDFSASFYAQGEKKSELGKNRDKSREPLIKALAKLKRDLNID